MKLRTLASRKQSKISNQKIDGLTLLSNLVAWVIVVICAGLGFLCLVKGGSGIQYGIAFCGLAVAVCPKVKVYWTARFVIGSVCLVLLS